MTIGAPDDLACFDRLVECRVEVARFLAVGTCNGLAPETDVCVSISVDL